MTKRLIILRGLPGSGKSKIAKSWAGASVCSADDFFMVDGEYRFDPGRIGEAHEACKLKAMTEMEAGVPVVIIDNTNVQHWEFQLYRRMARLFGYEVDIQVVGDPSGWPKYAARNIHGVPEDVVHRMAERWEP